MKLIAHRGNTKGPRPEHENRPEYIVDALRTYDVELDVWFCAGEPVSRITGPVGWGWYLGHDKPTYHVPQAFLEMTGLWVHVKNIEGMQYLLTHSHNIRNYFYHEHDGCALTSGGYIWTCDSELKNGTRTILMIPNVPLSEVSDVLYGNHHWDSICSDWVDNPFPSVIRNKR